MKTLAINPKKGKGSMNSFFLLLFGQSKAYCYWCGQQLHNCEKCRGKGLVNNQRCEMCDGSGSLCITHDKLWD